MTYLLVKWVHVLSATVLFGTGVGSAFYLLSVSLSRDTRAVALVARRVVQADWLFTATTMVVQPLTGWWMARLAGIPLDTPWLAWSIGLYVFAGACWLPVVWLQLRMRDLAQAAVLVDAPLPAAYWRLLWRWVALGFAAFFAFLGVFYLMVAKPV